MFEVRVYTCVRAMCKRNYSQGALSLKFNVILHGDKIRYKISHAYFKAVEQALGNLTY